MTVPTKTQLSNFLRTPGEDYFKGNPKSLNFYFLVIWWGKMNLANRWWGSGRGGRDSNSFLLTLTFDVTQVARSVHLHA